MDQGGQQSAQRPRPPEDICRHVHVKTFERLRVMGDDRHVIEQTQKRLEDMVDEWLPSQEGMGLALSEPSAFRVRAYCWMRRSAP